MLIILNALNNKQRKIVWRFNYNVDAKRLQQQRHSSSIRGCITLTNGGPSPANVKKCEYMLSNESELQINCINVVLQSRCIGIRSFQLHTTIILYNLFCTFLLKTYCNNIYFEAHSQNVTNNKHTKNNTTKQTILKQQCNGRTKQCGLFKGRTGNPHRHTTTSHHTDSMARVLRGSGGTRG